MSQAVNIDFDIKSDLYYLKIFDFSFWELLENRPSIIEITLPGYSEPFTKFFDKNKLNIFNSNSFSLGCVDCSSSELLTLPDGIYIIKVIGSPSTFNKEVRFLKTDQVQSELDRIYIDSFTNPSRKLILDKLTEIEYLLRGAEAHVRENLESEASMIFQQVLKKVDKLKNCKTCH